MHESAHQGKLARMRSLIFVCALGCTIVGCRTSPSESDGGGGGLADGGGGGGGGADLAGGGVRPCTLQCAMGFTCCDNACVNLRNDIHNCGACGVVCTGPQPFCAGTACGTAPCEPPCADGQLCCDVRSAVSRPPSCVAPTSSGTCPLGCPLCV
jgi:hypothetical protein